MAKRLLSYDPLTGIREWHDYDHSTRKTYITTEQDASKFLEFNKRCQSDSSLRQKGYKNDMMLFARVPNTVLVKWKKDHNIDFNRREDLPKIEKLLQSNEYKYLRTVDKI